jgi:hypothetical protein
VSESAAGGVEVGRAPPVHSARGGSPAGVVEYVPGQPNRLLGPHRNDYIRLGLIYWSRWARSSEMKDIMISGAALIERIEKPVKPEKRK